jgi:hypothetical protein
MSDGEPIAKVRCIYTSHTGLGSDEEILNRSVVTLSAPSGRPYEFEQAEKGDKFSRWVDLFSEVDAQFFAEKGSFQVRRAQTRWGDS